MALQQQFEQALGNLSALDASKKIALIVAILFTLATTVGISMFFSMPTTAPLYSNLTSEDVNNISRLLSENGIDFEAYPDTGVVEVAPHVTAKARVLLAEKGLPSSQASGYELFDKLNTLGLTSFMQDVTNKRAVEGELIRTIKMIEGVNSVRVHLVMAEKNVYRRNLVGAPSASVVLKTYGSMQGKSIVAIRNLVAAAVPGLESGKVTIVSANGTLLSSVDDQGLGGTTRLVDLEKGFENDIQTKISTALSAYLGAENFRVSVSAKLNSDQRKVSERVFDPDSKVARSVQIVREIGKSENKESSSPATVEQNLPDENAPAGAGQSSLENSERREEVTNYEINEKSISTISDGYNVENVSVALVVNKTRVESILGEGAGSDKIPEVVAELDKIIKSVVASSKERGDKISISVVEFLPSEFIEAEPEVNGIATFLALHFNSIFNGFGLIAAALIFSFFGIRPIIGIIVGKPAAAAAGEEDMLLANAGDGAPDVAGSIEMPDLLGDLSPAGGLGPAVETDGLESLAIREDAIKDHLEKMVSESEKRAAFAIKKWLKEESISA